MSDELLPCPFCGGTDVKLIHGDDHTSMDEDCKVERCAKCGAEGPTLYGRYHDGPDWNTRTPYPRIAELEAKNKRLLSALRSVDEADRSSPKRPDADKHKCQQWQGAMRKVRKELKGQGDES